MGRIRDTVLNEGKKGAAKTIPLHLQAKAVFVSKSIHIVLLFSSVVFAIWNCKPSKVDQHKIIICHRSIQTRFMKQRKNIR